MQAVRLQAGYALMEPAFLRQVVSDMAAAPDLYATSSRPARAPWPAWYSETAALFAALANGVAKDNGYSQ